VDQDEIRAAIASLGALLPENRPKVTVRAIVQRYMTSVEFKSLKARADEERRLRLHVLPHLGDDDIATLNNERIAWYRNTREGEPTPGGALTKPATRNREVFALSGALSWAAKEKHIKANPIYGTPVEPENNLRATCPTIGEVNRIVLASESVRTRAMVLTKFHSGMRVSELLSVRLDQVKWDDGLLVLEPRQTKGGLRPRVTIFPEQASTWVRVYLEIRTSRGIPGDLLFATDTGRPISRRNFLRDFQAVADRAGVKGANGETLTLHDLRSGFVGVQLEVGTSQEVIKAMLGHVSDSAFRRYVRVQKRWFIEARERTELEILRAHERRNPHRAAKPFHVDPVEEKATDDAENVLTFQPRSTIG